VPDFFCHLFLGKAAVAGMPAVLQEAAGADTPLFYLGCQGPDLFFYYKPLHPGAHRRAVSFASQCHNQNTRALLAYGASFLSEHRQDHPFIAYWTGLLCHYTLDRCAHPFVNSRTSNFRTHKKLELHLDAYMLRGKWAKAPYRVRIPRLIELKEGLPDSVIAFWTGLAQDVYGCQLDPEMIADSYKGMCTLTGLYYSPNPHCRPVKGLLARVIGLDISPYLSDFATQTPLLAEAEYAEFDACFQAACELAAPLGAQYAALLSGTRSLDEMDLPTVNFQGKETENPG
jgi:hypothetical protein